MHTVECRFDRIEVRVRYYGGCNPWGMDRADLAKRLKERFAALEFIPVEEGKPYVHCLSFTAYRRDCINLASTNHSGGIRSWKNE